MRWDFCLTLIAKRYFRTPYSDSKRRFVNWSKSREFLKLGAIVLWLIFAIVFALWWLQIGLEHVSLLARLDPEQTDHWNRQHRMILWEGGSWLVLLGLGGLALIALVQQVRTRARRLKQFFASFSHEIKTSLASLRLQAEALKDEQIEGSPILDRLVADTVRLQLQLENSLFLASQDELELFLESLALHDLVERMREQWPTLKIEMKRDCTVRADERALRTIFSNLIQNAINHGGATEVTVDASGISADQLKISLSDNGKGFAGSTARLGQLFHRPVSTSGSGLGLFICRVLLQKMNGDLTLHPGGTGFRAELRLNGALR
jgi:signal transduction histidine kinase